MASFIDGDAIEIIPFTGARLDNAANLAIDLGRPLKDCLYLALARELGCGLVTCDAKFASEAKNVKAEIILIGADRA